jgi:DNA-directed RNA polymerase specialized sigma24 family protein
MADARAIASNRARALESDASPVPAVDLCMTSSPFAVLRSSIEGLVMAIPVETLVSRVIAGDPLAWKELWRTVEPRLDTMLRRARFLGPLAGNEDARRDIVLAVMDALQADGHGRLHRFAEARAENPALSFFAWLAVVARRLAIDSMRRRDGYIDRRAEDRGGEWVRSETLPADSQLPGERPPFTNRVQARRVLDIAETLLGPEQHRALSAWSAGHGFDEIGGALGVSERHAERLVRAALERLRRRVRDGGGE